MKDLSLSHRPAPGRIVILNDSSVVRGGATSLAVMSARLLSRRGYHVTFIAGDAGDNGAMAADGIELIPLNGELLLDAGAARSARRGLHDPVMRRYLDRFIAITDTPDTVYHLHGWSRILSPSVFEALRPVAPRTLIHAHDFFLTCPNGAFFDFRRNELCDRRPLSASCLATNCDRRSFAHKSWRVLRQRALNKSLDLNAGWAGVLLPHPGMQPLMLQSGFPAGLMRTHRNPAVPFSRTRIRAEDNAVFCFVGRLQPGKGVEPLCHAARTAGVPLRVIGDTAGQPWLPEAFPEVEFTGWVEPGEVGTHLQDARALVMPSRFREPFGLVAAEASGSGLPVIVSDASLMSRDVDSSGLGLTVPVADPAAFADALRQMADMPAPRVREISTRGFARQDALAATPQDWADGLLEFYRTAIAQEQAA